MISTLNLAKLRAELTAATKAGMVQPQAPVKPVSKLVTTELQEAQLALDYDVLASFLQVEVNHAVSPLRLRTLLSRRLSELKESGELEGLPELVHDMLESVDVDVIKPPKQHRLSFELNDGKLVVSGGEFGRLLEKRGVQCMLHQCQWHLTNNQLTLFGGFVDFFSLEQLRSVWEGVACEFPS